MSSRSVLYSVILVSILMTVSNVSATAVNRGSEAMYEVTNDKSPTKVPVVKPWAAGKLDDSARTFDLVVTGNCAAGGNLKLDIKPGATRPDFFYTDKGKLLYAEPQPMAAVTMPKGHSASVMISLSDISHKTEMTDKVKDYICLGIKREGVISDEVLYGDTTHASILIDMYSENVVELVPLLSTTALASGYTKATPGSEAALVSGSIDFSSVYRVNIEVTKSESADPNTIPMDVEWGDVQECNLYELGHYSKNGYDFYPYWRNYGSMGVGPIKVEGKLLDNQLLAVSSKGDLAYSSDGNNWKLWGSIPEFEGTGFLGPVYGNDMWCVAEYFGYRIKYLRDGETEWKNFTPMPYGIASITFEKDMFMAITSSGEDNRYFVYVLTKDDTEWRPPNEESLQNMAWIEDMSAIFAYSNNKWIFDQYYYNVCDNPPKWNIISDLVSIDPVSIDNYLGEHYNFYDIAWNGRCYAHGYYYAVSDNFGAIIARSLDGAEWKFLKRSFALESGNSNDSFGITLYNDKLYVFSDDGKHFIVGTFVKPKPSTEPTE